MKTINETMNNQNTTLINLSKKEIEQRQELLALVLKAMHYDEEAGMVVLRKKLLDLLMEDWNITTKRLEQKLKELENRNDSWV